MPPLLTALSVSSHGLRPRPYYQCLLAPSGLGPSHPRAWVQATLVLAGLYFVLEGVPNLIYRFAITPAYYMKVAVLTLVAWFSNRTFVLRHPGQLPRFIAHSHSQDVRTFTLTPRDKTRVLSRADFQTSINPSVRYWRAPEAVLNVLKYSNPHRSPTHIPLNLAPYRLVGPRLAQGVGLIGHDFCVALVEEVGRIPGENGIIVGKFYSWDEERMILGRIPIPFVTSIGVEEVMEAEGGMVSFLWPDEGTGIVHGLQVEVWSTSDVKFALHAMDAAADDDSVLEV